MDSLQKAVYWLETALSQKNDVATLRRLIKEALGFLYAYQKTQQQDESK